ncbi:SRPBCC family protein [Streptomyces sp. NPDC057052]|uniref:SRPBCC family protein n=1 Tax=Streptomyces sp. NPDC057052 TaxID=3346010 RepID=UPI003627AA20
MLGTTTAPAAESARSTPSAPARTAHRDGCRGQGVDDSALIRYESDIVIDAPMSTVWKLQTDVERWPSWQPSVSGSERLDTGPLRRGSRFHWTTPVPATPTTPATALGITSTVQEIRQGHCVLWRGPAVGEGLRVDEGVHLWTFTKVGGGVHVHTEETWTGSQAEADVPTATAALGRGLETWLRDLEATAEARS